MSTHYDLVVIGAGSGGVRAARMASTYGAKVAIIEEYRLGGTCVIRGCVPKKLFVLASRYPEQFEVAQSFGWSFGEPKFDWGTLLANKDKEIDRLEGIYGNILGGANVEIIRDRGVITGPTSVKLAKANQELRADRILVATGGRPFVPNIPGAEMGITSNEAFHIKQLPKKILVNGGGYIAVEFAGIFAGLGVETTLLYRGDQILRGFDSDVRDMVAEQMKARGVTIKLESEITRMDRCASGNIDVSFSTGEVVDFGEVMFATGRVPNIEGLGLETADVKLNAGRAIHVDAYSQTSCPSIYAVGDVTNRAALTPVAIREGAAFVETVYNNNPMAVDHSLIPTAVFSEPEIGTVGLTEHDAASSRAKVNVYVSTFRPMQNTLTTRPEKMMFKLITDGETDEVLGVHIVGPSSGEMIQMVGIAVSMGATKADFDRTIAVHPTAAEELVTLKAPSYVIENGERQS
ncbi:glutathione-disulfide reductase [Maritalea porphyrae]|uniref:glutathione-disulfide reductase n=1 Tax=Maritalea porphyrae TaxID=880732 RepID=UPI0022AFBBBF|nr:glutathione-disulfide reductase [Maritalea porphyrae]MCZ4271026.1 glutathione-disulfide reductase [Maritalea porphyrae]